MMEKYICPRCGNSDQNYVGFLNGKPYCRKCISFRGEDAPEFTSSNALIKLQLNYSLSIEQKRISERVIYNFKRGYDTLINAVCGAGKTELVYGVIEYALKRKLAVAFALPRRDVVIELFERIKEAFPNNKIVSIYGGHTSQLSGDLVVLTTHQLYRFENYFDLIILDEIDAFPYQGSELLETMFKRAKKGPVVMMSATPNEQILKYFHEPKREILELNFRFHMHPLPVPIFAIKFGLFKAMFVIEKLREYRKEKKPCFVFAPTIEIAENLYNFLKRFVSGGNVVHSKRENRNEIIQNFKKKKYQYLVTTAVLERGVTVKNLQVIIFDADHDIYTSESLIQISGRVGRKYDAPEGDVFFVSKKITEHMEKARDTIATKNKYLQNMF